MGVRGGGVWCVGACVCGGVGGGGCVRVCVVRVVCSVRSGVHSAAYSTIPLLALTILFTAISSSLLPF